MLHSPIRRLTASKTLIFGTPKEFTIAAMAVEAFTPKTLVMFCDRSLLLAVPNLVQIKQFSVYDVKGVEGVLVANGILDSLHYNEPLESPHETHLGLTLIKRLQATCFYRGEVPIGCHRGDGFTFEIEFSDDEELAIGARLRAEIRARLVEENAAIAADSRMRERAEDATEDD